jgi:hypothetical protein
MNKREGPRGRPDDGNAFVPDTTGQSKPLASADAESFAEEFIGSATGAESVSEDAEDEVVDEEEGGPFIVLDADGQLPTEPEEHSADRDGSEPVQKVQLTRAARWAARGV